MHLSDKSFTEIVTRANLAPSIHNTQPSRWRKTQGGIDIAADNLISLPQADPDGAGIALSVGAAVEATVLALSDLGIEAQVSDCWADDNRHDWKGHRLAARITFAGGSPDPLATSLPDRGTWRGPFVSKAPDLYGWTRADMRVVLDAPTKAMIAQQNDTASLIILRNKAFRAELLSWMRLTTAHPRCGLDGMDKQALRMDTQAARSLRLGFGPLWPVLDTFGRTRAILSEAEITQNTPLIAAFHRPKGESPISTGRAYLRLWLEATQLGFAGWPMAALTDHAAIRQDLEARLGIDPDHRLVQVLRFGRPLGVLPEKARRPITELTQ